MNLISQDDKFPLPLISDVLDKIKGAKIYTKLDCTNAYHTLKITEEDQHMTAFTWNGVVFKFRRAPFGLKQIPAKFSRTMTIIFKGHSHYVVSYMDDILVFSFDVKLHTEHVKTVVQLLTKHAFRLNPKKCLFCQQQVIFLGHVVDAEGVYINPGKLIDCEKWHTPRTEKELQHFLGFANYWRDNVPLMSTLTAPLDRLRGEKHIMPFWTLTVQDAYDRIMAILKAGVFLHHADFTQPFYGASDASGYGIGGCVYQIVEGVTKYVCFYSRSLTTSEQNYSATKRELLALIWVIRKGHTYFWGNHFTFYTDHAALTYYQTQKKLNSMILNWLDELLDYNFTVVHRPGVLNILPDHLSRLYPAYSREYDYCIRRVTAPCVDKNGTVDGNWDDTGPTRQPRQVIWDEFEEPTEEHRKGLLEKQHLLRHFGADTIVQGLRNQGIAWTAMKKEALEIVRACVKCQRYNVQKNGYHPMTSITASLPGDHYAIDLAGPYTTTDRRNNYLFVCVDICTRFVLLKPITDKTAVTVATTVLEITCTFGFPKILQSDNGTEFVNSLIKIIKTTAGFEHRLITPYHPQANGVAERYVQSTMRSIRKSTDGVRKDWNLYVYPTMLALNLKVAARHGSTPFSLMFARTANGFQNFTASLNLTGNFDGEGYVKELENLTKIVFPAIEAKVQAYIDARMKDKTKEKSFPPGAYVMAVNKTRQNKFEAAYEGPFKVMRRNKGGAYILQDTDGTTLGRNYTPGELKIISHDPDTMEKSYAIEKIVDHRGEKGNYEYFIKWKGYDNSENTWEKSDMFNDVAVIDKYWTKIHKAGKAKKENGKAENDNDRDEEAVVF